MDITIGEPVWWGDPASPTTGIIQAVSKDKMTAFILLSKGKKRTYNTIPVNKLNKLESNHDDKP